METTILLDKWKTAPDVDEIIAHLRKQIELRHACGRYGRDELRRETALWLSEVLDGPAPGESALHDYLDMIGEWRMQLHPNFSTHRGRIGRLFVWLKKRVLHPPLRWIVEIVEVNAWRQDRLNISLLNLLKEMALEIGRLRARLDRLERPKIDGPDKTSP